MNYPSEAGQLYQYTGVAIEGRGVLIEGPPGCGKTSLALALIDSGATLIGDDGVRLERGDGHIVAHPPSHTRGKIEVRNVGICDTPCISAPVALILAIDENAPRFVDSATSVTLLDIATPKLAFAIGSPVDAIRVRYALERHGHPNSVPPIR